MSFDENLFLEDLKFNVCNVIVFSLSKISTNKLCKIK